MAPSKDKNESSEVEKLMDPVEVRMRCIEVLTPGLSRLDIRDPETIINKARSLENYIVNGYDSDKGEDNKPQQKPGKKKAKDDILS